MENENIVKETALSVAKETAKDVYADTVQPTAKNVGGFFGTLSGFFNHVVMYPLKKLNIRYEQKAIAFEKEMEHKYNSIPEKERVEPQLHIVGPTMESLKYNIMDDDLYVRDKIETKGVFVHCFTDVTIDTARGFSIYNTLLPIIGINDEDRPPAKTFTIIHELVHLFKRESSLCNDMSSSASTLSEEVFCNAVAGELLVPKRALRIVLEHGHYFAPYSIDDIKRVADRFSVSREVIVRRLLELRKIDQSEYETYADLFRREIEEDREKRKIQRENGIKSSIPRNMSREAIDRTSPSVSKILYQGYVNDVYSKLDIARHLNVGQNHIDKFLREVSKWNR